MRLSAIPALLRRLAPEHLAYERLTGRQVRDELTILGVRTVNSGGVPQLYPSDLREVAGQGSQLLWG